MSIWSDMAIKDLQAASAQIEARLQRCEELQRTHIAALEQRIAELERERAAIQEPPRPTSRRLNGAR